MKCMFVPFFKFIFYNSSKVMWNLNVHVTKKEEKEKNILREVFP